MVHTLAEGITAFLLKRTQPKEESEIYTYGMSLSYQDFWEQYL